MLIVLFFTRWKFIKATHRTYVHIYFLLYNASAEVQTYLTSLRREKEAIELPIREIGGWKSCAIIRIVCGRRKPNRPCRRITSASSANSCSNFRNSSGLRTRTFSDRRIISIRSWKPSGVKAFLSPNMKIVSTAPWRRPSVPRMVMKTLRWRVHRSHLLSISRPTPS